MQSFILALALLVLASFAYRLGRGRALAVAGGQPRRLHSLPSHYGLYVALWCGIPAFAVLAAYILFEPTVVRLLVVWALPPELQGISPDSLGVLLNEVRNTAAGHPSANPAVNAAAETLVRLRHMAFATVAVLALSLGIAGTAWGRARIHAALRARQVFERNVDRALVASSTVAIFTTVGIVLSLVFEAARFFHAVPVADFIFGLSWSPQMAIRADQVGSSGAFGAIPLFAGTLLITLIAMVVAVPLGLLSAIYMAEYARPRVRAVVKPLLEILAGVPTVVYGFFAVLTVAPAIRAAGGALGLPVASESALAAGAVMGIMIIPFISSLSDDVITAVPQSLREGSLGLGATRSETIRMVVLPAALPGIVGGILLAVSRAIGETMIVVMAAGLQANLTLNPLEAVTTVTVQIVTLLVGDSEFDSPKTLAAFALGLVLFFATLALNAVALHIVRKYREQYD
ncbi:MAG: phosphate ABC transporter permease subunit PstC [Actinomycetota bacterium]